MLRDGSKVNDGAWAGASAGGDHEQKCERVHRTLKRIVKARGALDAQECAALREAQKLMLWRAYGCASFVEYMEREMGYTQRAAIERLRVAKVIEEVPELGEAMNQGDLSFSGARELARVVTPETQNEWIAAAQDKCVRQIEEMVSGHKPGDRPTDAPDPGLKTKILRHEVKLSVAELERRARKTLQRLRGSSVDDSEFMEACFKALLDQCEGASTRRSSTNSTSISGGSTSGVSTSGVSTSGVSTSGVSTSGVSTSGVSTSGVSTSGVSTSGVSTSGVSTSSVSTSSGSTSGGSTSGGSTSSGSTSSVSTSGVSTSRISTSGVSTSSVSASGDGGLAIVSPWSVGANGRVPSEAEIELLLMPRYQNANTICTECKRGWQHGVGTTLLTPAEVERALCDCEDIGCIDDVEPSRSMRSVPKPLKRHVLHRDGYRCRVPGCSATANIDVHHIVFLMNGGKNTLPNLITLCEGHHLALHEGSLVIEGDANSARFTRVPQNKFKTETRVVECKAALQQRGFAKELIKAAVEATRTHVGQQDLTAQQWVDIALTKLPRRTR